MTKILCVSEGFILELAKYPACNNQFTDIFEKSASHIVDRYTAQEFISTLCRFSSEHVYYVERYDRLKRRFLEIEFEVIHD